MQSHRQIIVFADKEFGIKLLPKVSNIHVHNAKPNLPKKIHVCKLKETL